MAKSFIRPSFWGTVVMVFVAIAALLTVDAFLAKMEQAESHAEAARLFDQAKVLMEHGGNDEAIERIRDAMVIERDNRDYQRTLAQAQFAAGKTADAESTLTDLLRTDSSDGLASLMLARVLEKEGRYMEAVSYFHRAVYGQWSQDTAGNRLRARFELIDLLAQQNSKQELLAELLSVQAEAPGDLKTKTRIGQLFLLAGSPARAADVFQGILHDTPNNADAYLGLGEADFARGSYRAAQREFQAALRLAPGSPGVLQRLALCNELLMLDPTVRGLGRTERFRRSVRVVGLTLEETSQCVGPDPSPKTQELFDTAAKVMKARVSAARQADVSESNLDLAERLWQVRQKECKAPSTADTPLALVQARLAQ
jgi:tetratricopeptide (TPR) repeat protein